MGSESVVSNSMDDSENILGQKENTDNVDTSEENEPDVTSNESVMKPMPQIKKDYQC